MLRFTYLIYAGTTLTEIHQHESSSDYMLRLAEYYTRDGRVDVWCGGVKHGKLCHRTGG